MENMGVAVGAHVPEFLHWGALALTLSTTFTSTTTCIGVFILIVELVSYESVGGGELLDFGLHHCQFVLRLDIGSIIGCDGCPGLASCWMYSLISSL
jgi:hypothetical protein